MLVGALLIAAQTAFTLTMVEALAPEAAGTLALSDQAHDLIETVRRAPTTPLQPPGLVEVEMIERALIRQDICVRRRWTVAFRYGPNETPDQAVRHGSFAREEIELLHNQACPQTFVGLNVATDRDMAAMALKRLNAIRAGKDIRFACTDTTKSGLCAGPGSDSQGSGDGHALAAVAIRNRHGVLVRRTRRGGH